MIDNLFIRLNKELFCDNRRNWTPIHRTKSYVSYTLDGSSFGNGYQMIIIENQKSGNIRIRGSLRKWLFGETTLKDLDSQSFIRSLKKLAKALNISYKELCKGKISECEIGLNIKTSKPASVVIPQIVAYRHLKEKRIKDETVYYEGADKKIIVYNKTKEIVDNIGEQKRRIAKQAAFSRLSSKGHHYIRMEVKMKDQKSFSNHKLRIATLGDLVDSFGSLYEIWTKEMNKVLIFSTPILSDEMDKRDFLIAFNLRKDNFEELVNEYCKISAKNTKTDKAKYSARSTAYKEILSVLTKYGSKNEYNQATFKKDIAKSLVRISKNDDTLRLSHLFSLLWHK